MQSCTGAVETEMEREWHGEKKASGSGNCRSSGAALDVFVTSSTLVSDSPTTSSCLDGRT